MALALCGLTLAGTILAGAAGTAHGEGQVDVTKDCSITFQLDTEVAGYTNAQQEVMAYLQANPEKKLEIRLHPVAAMTEAGGFTLMGAFKGNAGLAGIEKVGAQTKAAEWEVFAKAALDAVRGGAAVADSKTLNLGYNDFGAGGYKVEHLSPGLYLVDIQPLETDTVGYVFTPYLAAVPGYDADGSYLYNIVSGLKPSRDGRAGDLCIVKELPECRVEVAGTTFVFEVTARIGGNIVFNDVYSMVFEEHGTQQLYVTGIPADAEVTVEEVYSGGPYVVNGDALKSVEMVANGTAYVNFRNDYDNDAPRPGLSAVNHMTVEKGTNNAMTLHWEQLDSSTGRVNGRIAGN